MTELTVFEKIDLGLCIFCSEKHDGLIECDAKIQFRNDSEGRYLEDRRKRLGGFDDGWRGD